MPYIGPPFGWHVAPGYTFDNAGKCASCHADIAWCITPKGSRAPMDPDGASHFATCPSADLHRKPRNPDPLGTVRTQREPFSMAAAKAPGVVEMTRKRRQRILVHVYTEPDVWSASLWEDWEAAHGIPGGHSPISSSFSTMFGEGLVIRPMFRTNRRGHPEHVYRISPELDAVWDGTAATLQEAIGRAYLRPQPTSNRGKRPKPKGMDL